MSELKACPFCGKTDGVYSIPRMIEIIDGVNTYPEWAIGCKNCDAHLYRAYYAKDDGIATWNTRPIEDELRAELEKRTAELHYANTACMEMKHELARRDEYILKLEAKIPKLNIDLAEASMHAYNGESARMKLEAQLASRDASLLTEGEQKEILSYIRGNYDRDKIPCWLLDLIDGVARRDEIIARLKEVLPTLKISHNYCEDCWYSCPKHEDGCCNEAAGEDCNCGADEHNSKIDALMQEAERKTFCPNCEAETPCTHEAELFVCDICGEDFAKYIVSRNCSVSDVSMTRDVKPVKRENDYQNDNRTNTGG